MPEHSSFISFLLDRFPALAHNAQSLGAFYNFPLFTPARPTEGHDLAPPATAILVLLFLVGAAALVRPQLRNVGDSIVPETRLSLRTVFELFVGFFYGLTKDVMGDKRARRFFPVIGTCALFIFFANLLGLIPGFVPPTSILSVTAGCALFSLFAFTYYGFKENGFGFVQHLFGPWLGWAYVPVNVLVFLIEVLSTFIIRPVTLAIRLMVNMAVDHLVVGTFLGLVALFVPLPTMVLGVIVVVVQTMVFSLLTCVYIALATEHGHDEAH